MSIWLASGSSPVSRGGSWSFDRPNAWVAYRCRDAPGDRSILLGLRLVRRLP